MGNVHGEGKPLGFKQRLMTAPTTAVDFLEEHPVLTKAYVPIVVTATLLVQMFQGCN